MSEEFDFEKAKEGVDKWLIAFKQPYDKKHWTSMEIPGFLSKRTVELIMAETNEISDIAYARVVMGVTEPKKHKVKKGEFIGI